MRAVRDAWAQSDPLKNPQFRRWCEPPIIERRRPRYSYPAVRRRPGRRLVSSPSARARAAMASYLLMLAGRTGSDARPLS